MVDKGNLGYTTEYTIPEVHYYRQSASCVIYIVHGQSECPYSQWKSVLMALQNLVLQQMNHI